MAPHDAPTPALPAKLPAHLKKGLRRCSVCGGFFDKATLLRFVRCNTGVDVWLATEALPQGHHGRSAYVCAGFPCLLPALQAKQPRRNLATSPLDEATQGKALARFISKALKHPVDGVIVKPLLTMKPKDYPDCGPH